MTAALLARVAEANAQPSPSLLPRVELDYRVDPSLACPSAEEVQAEIVRELKWNPFRAPGPVVGLFHVVASPKAPDAIEIPVTFDDVVGMRSFKASFDGPRRSTTCGHLVRTHVVDEIATRITVLMGRTYRALLAARVATADCSSGSGSTPSACGASRFDLWPEDWPSRLPKPKPDPPPLPERWPFAIRVGAAVGPEVIASGWANLGLSAEVGARYKAVSAGLVLHGDPPLGSLPYPHASVAYARLSGALLLCGHFGYFAACGVADVGRIIFTNDVPALPASAFYGAAGAQANLEFPVAAPHLYLKTSLDLRAPIHPVSYPWMNANLFQTAGLGVGLGVGLLMELPPP